MNNINTGRVVLGGLLTGLVLNIGEFLMNEVVMGSRMKDWFAAHNVPQPSGSFIAIACVMTLILGIVIVLTYALIRSRLGPGVKTAIIAGLILWFAVYVYTGIINGLLFGFTMNVMGMSIIWGLVEYTLAAIAGAWVYKEA